MSNGDGYGMPWQKPVGWLVGSVPKIAEKPQIEVAKKLAYYMNKALSEGRYMEYNSKNSSLFPADSFYQMDGCRGPHSCDIDQCGMRMSGVFGWRDWKFPTGIVHYILDHQWQPPADFLAELAELPDPPADFTAPVWVAPNKLGLFQDKKPAMR